MLVYAFCFQSQSLDLTDTPKDPNRRPSLTAENEDLFNAHDFDIKIELDFPLPGKFIKPVG